MKPLVAVAQMTSQNDLEANFAVVERLAKLGKAQGASLVCFPENFAYFGKAPNDAARIAEGLDGPCFSRYRALASSLKLELSYGGFQECAPHGRVFNTHVVVGSDGAIKGAYRKIHLFVVDLQDGTKADETAHVDSGSELVTVQSTIGTLGLSICYDLRFPELYQKLTLQGSQVLLVPAAFTATTGKAHWEVLLRARAIENQCYVAAAAQVGSHPGGRLTHGHAMIVDPWGTVLAQCSSNDELALAEIDLESLDDIRKRLPVSRHRRPDLFS